MAVDPITASAVDDILDFDFSDAEDPFADNSLVATRDDKATLSPRAAKRKLDEDKENLGLGLDEEVKITKKRKPTVKLDESRLLSEPGIPRLRALARSGKITRNLRLKGKGHEFSDVARLLNYYQLWLDGLYPRAKFADGLQLVEKVGHSKRMNVMRKEWIDAGKPDYIRQFETRKHHTDEADQYPEPAHTEIADKGHDQDADNPDDFFFPERRAGEKSEEAVGPDEDELDVLMGNLASKSNAVDSEGEDDLDALLAAEEARSGPMSLSADNPAVDDDDDLDALLAEQESRRFANPSSEPSRSRAAVFNQEQQNQDDDEDNVDNDDLDAPLNERDAGKELEMKTVEYGEENSDDKSPLSQVEAEPSMLSSSPLPNNPEEDDLDALLAEHEASI